MIFGYEYIVDAYSCDKDSILNINTVKLFFRELIQKIGMQMYYHEDLHMQVHVFGNDKTNYGITGFVPILTSSITIHTVELTGNIYLNVFSCKRFSPNKVDECVDKFFKPNKMKRLAYKR